jgi:hypothetical protein
MPIEPPCEFRMPDSSICGRKPTFKLPNGLTEGEPSPVLPATHGGGFYWINLCEEHFEEVQAGSRG